MNELTEMVLILWVNTNDVSHMSTKTGDPGKHIERIDFERD